MLIRNTVVRLQKLYSTVSQNHHQTKARTMGMSLKDIINSLQSFAPLSLAESWDNVGLLVDPMSDTKINTVLLTNDLTEDVVEEAVRVKAGLVITYHPNIFQGFKSVSSSTWKERIVVQCIRNQIAVFSPHTSWDSVEGGVNDWLASAFSFKAIKAIKETPDSQFQGAGRLLRFEIPLTAEKVVRKVKDHIGVNHLRLALAKHKGLDSPVSIVALCAGSGASVFKGVEADLYLTGEMSHHEVLDATQNGIHVILCEHSNSERGFLKRFQQQLHKKLLSDSVAVVVSEVDKDPLITM